PVDSEDPLQGLGGSAYLRVVHGKKSGAPPRCELDQARTLHTTLLGLIQSGVVKSAHDCSEGGLAVALAESCISQQIARETPRLIGAQIDLAVAPPPAAMSSGTSVTQEEGKDRGEEVASLGISHRLDALFF